MLNKDVFATDPALYRIANQGVSRIIFPPSAGTASETLRGELQTFVCDGEYAKGLVRILEAYLRNLGRGIQESAWISGFYGSGKSHLANMLCALWTDIEFSDGARASGLVHGLPDDIKSALTELRQAAKRAGGLHAAGGTLGSGPDDPVLATLAIVLQSVGLPTDVRAARVAFWLADERILDDVRARLGVRFDDAIRNFVLATDFADAVLAAKPSLAPDQRALRELFRTNFPPSSETTVADLSRMTRQALLLGRQQIPLTVLALDETQQFIRLDPERTLVVQNIEEQLSAEFDGRVMLVCTGQQALTDVPDLQKLLGRFPVRVSLGEADIDAVIHKTVLRKRPEYCDEIRKVLDTHSGEISRHLRGSRFAHTNEDQEPAVLDWPLLPSRRRVWERVLRSLDQSGLGGTLRSQLRVVLDAARSVADRPLGYAVAADFLYGRFADEAFSGGALPEETRARISKLEAGDATARLKARVLMLIYMLGRIQGDADYHGVKPTAEIIADLLISDLSGDADIRRRVPEVLESLRQEGAVIEIQGLWRLQTKESAEWEQAYKSEERAKQGGQAEIAEGRRKALDAALGKEIGTLAAITHGASRQSRRIHRIGSNERAPSDGIALRIHNGWDVDLKTVERDIAAAPTSDATIHLLLPRIRADALRHALVQQMAAQTVLDLKGVPETSEGKEARAAMELRLSLARRQVDEIAGEAVQNAEVRQAGGSVVTGTPAEAVRKAADNAVARLFPRFADGDHPGWERVVSRARRGEPDAIKHVDHNGQPESHPVCREILNWLGAGKKGIDIRKHFEGEPYGWPQDAVDGALLVLDNAGHLRVMGEDGKPVALKDLDRRKTSLCSFRPETTTVTAPQRIAVRGLLSDAGVRYERDQEGAVLPALLDRLAEFAAAAGGPPPAPAAPQVPGMTDLRSLSGNDLLVEIASKAADLKSSLQGWRQQAAKIAERTPCYRLAERLVELGATGQRAALISVRDGRRLLDDPDPVPPILIDAAGDLRARINEFWADYERARQEGEARLAADESWNKLSPEQKHEIRQHCRLLPTDQPQVGSPQEIADTLSARALHSWQDLVKSIPTRITDGLQDAALQLEPKIRMVSLPGTSIIRDKTALDAWLADVRTLLAQALAAGPIIPRV